MKAILEELLEGVDIKHNTKVYFSGVDKKKLAKLKEDAKRKTITSKQKEELLDKIDKAIEDSFSTGQRSTVGKEVVTILGSQVLPVLPLLYQGTRMLNKEERKAYRKELYDLHSIVKSMKVKD